MADHPFDGGEAAPQRALELVDELVDVTDGAGGIDVAVEVHDLAVVGIANAHVVDVAQRAGRRRELREPVA